ncbi:MAG: SDR family NAD(P)-dependent oxidoreductase [Halarcobacter sp.]
MSEVILVTASSRGLGLEIAKDLSNSGYSILLNGRNKESLFAAMEKLSCEKEHFLFTYDLTKEDAVNRLKFFLEEKNITIIGVVHNLGGKVENDIQPLFPKTLAKSIRLNLESAIDINNFLIPKMMNNGYGTIIHIGSSSGYNGNAAPAYAISKGALNTYVKNTARFYAKDGIRICAVLPGILDHEGSEWDKKRLLEPEKYQQRKLQMPLQRFAKPNEIAPFISSIFKTNSMQVAGSIISLEGAV